MVESAAEVESLPVETDSEPSSKPTEKEAKIIRQIEYYFGDINLPRDKFLLEEIKSDEGWISLDTMVKFNRLAQISKDFVEIIDALKKSNSGLIEINKESNKIRRSPHVPLPEMNEERRKELISRTAYIRRFPLEYKIDDILDFCAQHKLDQDTVILRHYHDKALNKWVFKGSVFVTFKTVEACKAFVEGEDIELNGEKLTKMWQTAYQEEKRQERLGDKSKNKKGQKSATKNGSNAKEDGDNGDNEESDGFPLGAVVHLTGFKENSQMKREAIKGKIEGFGIAVSFIDFNMGESAAWVRMEVKDSAKELAKKVAEEGDKLKIDDEELTMRVLEGEEEETFLAKAKEQMLKRRNTRNKPKRGGYKGGRGRGRKRAGSPPSRHDKKSRVE